MCKDLSKIPLTGLLVLSFAVVFILWPVSGCNKATDRDFNTKISIKGAKWHFNDQIINPGSPAEGLLMNVRMVNSVFEDRGPELANQSSDFNPVENTKSFILKIPEYVSSGINAFTISLQGGLPGYEGAVNTAFNADGSLRDEYMQRVEKVIRACNENNAAVILSLFYQRQHSHKSALTGKESIMKAVENLVEWITRKSYTNVVLEISNEYSHGGYLNWTDGEWFISEAGQAEMIRYAKQLNPDLLVSTSGMGNGFFHEVLAMESDFLLIHFNNTSLEDYSDRINSLKKYNKPIVCNEDDKIMKEGAIGLALSVINGAGWGYMNSALNQYFPFIFKGTKDDQDVYRMFKNMGTPGYQINHDALKHSAITITYPNDGYIIKVGQRITFRLSHIFPDSSGQYNIELLANDQPVAVVGNNLRVSWQPDEPGLYNFRAVVEDQQGNELYRSADVDIIVQAD